jgi:hypothetical protein
MYQLKSTEDSNGKWKCPPKAENKNQISAMPHCAFGSEGRVERSTPRGEKMKEYF